jgi:outer membrane autotransporter protein
MNKKISSLILLTSITLPLFAKADVEDSLYLGAYINHQKISTFDREFKTLGAMIGYQYNEYFALEARLGTGISGFSDNTDLNGSLTQDIDLQSTINFKASYPLTESFSVYGVVGFTNTKMSLEGVWEYKDQLGNSIGTFDIDRNKSPDGVNYGLGLNYSINNDYSVFFEYQVLPEYKGINESGSWNSINLGLSYSF